MKQPHEPLQVDSLEESYNHTDNSNKEVSDTELKFNKHGARASQVGIKCPHVRND